MSDEILCLARQDAEKATQHGFDLNPYSTDGVRHLWQLGFDGLPLPATNAVGSYNWRAWERGRCAKLIQQKGGAA